MPRLPSKHQPGDRVYHVLNGDGGMGIVTAVEFHMDGGVLYWVQWDRDSNSRHYDGELDDKRAFRREGEAMIET